MLGVESDATDAEIKSAYRQRVMELHPDWYPPDSKPFLTVQEAYSVLGDPQRRQAYDNAGRARQAVRRAAAEPFRATESNIDLGEVSLGRSFESYGPSFYELFDRLWSNFGGLSRPKAERVESLTVDVPITAAQAYRGAHVQLLVPVQAQCPTCHGDGAVGVYECWRCAGHGAITAEYPVTVASPPGATSGYVARVPLDQFGIRNFYLTVCFRVSGEDFISANPHAKSND